MLFYTQLKSPYFGGIAVTFLPHILFCFSSSLSNLLLSKFILFSQALFHLLMFMNASPFFQISGFFLVCISFLLPLDISNPLFSFY